jgi:hypothetical protein
MTLNQMGQDVMSTPLDWSLDWAAKNLRRRALAAHYRKLEELEASRRRIRIPIAILKRDELRRRGPVPRIELNDFEASRHRLAAYCRACA